MAWVWLLLGLLYILSPYDLLPDFLPVRGWIDDIIVLIVMIRYIVRLRRGASTAEPGQHASNRQTGGNRQEKTHDNGRQAYHGPRSPHEILGVPPHASQEEIRSAYRRLAGRYHPDKVAHLGKEFQELAEKRFKEIQNAYDRLAKS